MRNRLTHNERWELGLFVGIASALCVLLAAAIQLRQVPALEATQKAVPQAPGAAWPVPQVTLQPTLQFQEPALSLDDLLPPVAKVPVAPAVAKATPAAGSEVKLFSGKPYRLAKTLRLRVTAYAADPRCTYPYDGKTTASGMPSTTNGGKLAAADTSLISMHSLVSVPGYAANTAVPVLDRGGAIKGYRLDVMMPSYEAAQKWGSRMLDVKVYAPAK
jgi:3D (Asp-Asp-Asp) domain-containing protein